AKDGTIREAVIAAAERELEAALARGLGRHARAKDGGRVGRALEALERLGQHAAGFAPLIGRFVDAAEGSTTRWRGLRALGPRGPGGAGALADIGPLRTSSDPRDRLWACFALASIRAEPAAVDEIIDAVLDGSENSRRAWDEQLLAAELLGRLRA